MNTAKETTYSNVLHATITKEQSDFTGLKEGDLFAIDVWNDEKGDSKTYIGRAQVSNIVEYKLSYMFHFNGSLNHIYFDLEEQ